MASFATLADNYRCPFANEELLQYANTYPTRFHLYDEALIRENCRRLQAAFSWAPGFKNYFAVKGTPNPSILKIVKDEGFGADCCSISELLLAQMVGWTGEEINVTSSNTPIEEYAKAKELGAVINVDDFRHIELIRSNIGLPAHISLGYNPGNVGSGIGNRCDQKFGMTEPQILDACVLLKNCGVKRITIRIMAVFNCRDVNTLLQVAILMFELVAEIKANFGFAIDTINLGGGLGISYKPEEEPLDLECLGRRMQVEYENKVVQSGLAPLCIVYECARFITGPAGVLLTRVINKKNTYRSYLGVDGSMVNVMRTVLFGAYNHMRVIRDPSRSGNPEIAVAQDSPLNEYAEGVYNIVGSLMDNSDKLAIGACLCFGTRREHWRPARRA